MPPLRILVVEDDEALVRFYREALGDLGHDVRIARNGAEGLEALGTDLDLVVTDIGMPVMSGDEMLREMRRRPEYAGLPVLILTARLEGFEDLLAGDRTAILRKPFPLERFVDFVESALRAPR